MPTRSQRHLREVHSYDSSGAGGTIVPITGILPDTATIVAAGTIGRTIATMSVTGGTAPVTYVVANAAGLSLLITGNLLKTNANPVGTAGVKAVSITATDSRGQTRTETISVTVT